MRIGELAARAGVSTSKIRFYEAQSLLPPASRLANGYRVYGDGDLRAVTFINRAQSLGFTLREIAAHMKLPAGERRKTEMLRRLETKLAELDCHLADVRARRAMVMELILDVRQALGNASGR
jgi:MerR family copper efflux transcriptional regulator